MTDGPDEQMVTNLSAEMMTRISEEFAILRQTMREELASQIGEALANRGISSEEGGSAKPGTVDEAMHFNDYATQLFYSGQPEQAAQLLEEAVRSAPGLAEIHHNLAVVYTSLGQMERAVGAFQKAVEIAPEQTAFLNTQGVMALFESQADKAIDILGQIDHSGPEQIAILLNLGQAYETAGRTSEAVRAWREVIAIDPHQSEARQCLRQYYQDE